MQQKNQHLPRAVHQIITVNDTTGNMFLGLWKTSESNAVQLYIVYRGTQTSAEWSRDLETEQVPWPPSESITYHVLWL